MDTDTTREIVDRIAMRLSVTMVVSSFVVAGFSAWSAGGLIPVAVAGTCCVAAAWSSPAVPAENGGLR